MSRLALFLLPGAVVFFLASGLAGSGCSGGGPSSDLLPAPTMVAATGGDGRIVVTWAEVEGAHRYLVYSAREPGVRPDNYDDLDGGRRRESSDADHGEDVDNGETRFYAVTAVDGGSREGALSAEVVAAASPWLRPQVLEPGSGDALAPHIAGDADGGLYAVWSRQQTGRYAIRESRWTGAAQAWTVPAAIDSSAGFSHAPRIAATPAGDAVAAWRQGTGPDDRIWVANYDSGIGWSAPLSLDSGAGASRRPALAVEPGGDALAAWARFEGNTHGVQSARWDSGAQSWGPRERLDIGTSDSGDPDVALDGTGNGFAVWAQNGAIHAARLASGFWSVPAMVTGTAANASSPRIATNEAGRAILAWEQETDVGSDIAAATYTIAGGWSSPSIIDAHPLAASSPRVAIGAVGNSIVVWNQVNGARTTVGMNRHRPGTGGWGLARIVEVDDSGNASDAVAVFDDTGDALVAFSQQVVDLGGPGVTENIYSKRVAVVDTSESTVVMLVSGYGLNTEPQLVIGSGGTATAVWVRYGTAGNEIWINRLP